MSRNSDEYWRRRLEHERLVQDVGEIRQIAEDYALERRGQELGPFEVEVIDVVNRGAHQLATAQAESSSALVESIAEGLADLSDDHFELVLAVAAETTRRQDLQTYELQRVHGEIEETRFVLEDILDVQRYDLVVAGAQLAVSYAQLDRLESIEGSVDYLSDQIDEIGDTLSYHGELLESIDEGVWGLHERIGDLEDTVVEVGQHVARTTIQVGEAIVREIRVSAQRSAQVLGDHITRTAQAQVAEIQTSLAILDRHAHVRHVELIQAVRSPVGNAANEKYAQARTLFQNGELGLSLGKLSREVFAQDSTHQLGWILYGEISQRRGRPKEARAAFTRARDYALIHKSMENYELACIRFSRLECAVGKPNHAMNILVTAHRNVLRFSGTRSGHLKYEMFKIRFQEGQHRWKKKPVGMVEQAEWSHKRSQWEIEQINELRGILLRAPELHDDVAHNPLFRGICLFSPLSWGNAPFIQLFDLLELFKNVFSKDPRFNDDPAVESFVDILRKVLYLVEAGRVRHAPREWDSRETHPHTQDVFDVLTRLQEFVVSFAQNLDTRYPLAEGNGNAIFAALCDAEEGNYEECERTFETLFLYYVDHVNDPLPDEEPFDREYVHPEEVIETTLRVVQQAHQGVTVLPTIWVRFIEEKLSRCFSYDTRMDDPPCTAHVTADPEAVAWIKQVQSQYCVGQLDWISKNRPELETRLKTLMKRAQEI